MPEPKFTPGPWKIPDQTWRTRLTVEALGEGVACPGSGGAMSYTHTICTLDWNGTPEWDANARLIAAAPSLYAALDELREAVADALCNEGIPGFDPYRLPRAQIAASNAILKARGEV